MDLKVVGNNIRTLRNERKFNQENIASFLGVDQTFISKVESGERALSADALEKLANLFGISLLDFENETLPKKTFLYAFRASDMTVDDMEAIATVNKIAANADFMEKIWRTAN